MAKLIDTLDKSKEVESDVRNTLNLLHSLAKAKSEKFHFDLVESITAANEGIDKELKAPVTTLIVKDNEIRITTKTKPTDLINHIGASVKKIIRGGSSNIIDGITGILTEGLSTLMGVGSGEAKEVEHYFLTTSASAVVRVDIKSYFQKIQVKSIKDHATGIFVYSYSQYAVDVKKLDFNAFLAVYGNILVSGKKKLKAEQIEEEMQKAKKFFKEFGGKMPNTDQAPQAMFSTSLSSDKTVTPFFIQ